MTEATEAAGPNDTKRTGGTDKVPAYSWYALSVLVLVYVLNFIDRQKSETLLHRHGFDRADIISRMAGDDLLFARHERDAVHPDARNDAVIDFTGE